MPQCYLRQFANKHGKAHHVSVFDRTKAQSYKSNTQDVACQNYFNRIQLDGMDPDALEAAMSEFETKLADALAGINEVRNLENEDDRAHLLTLIGLTALRNPDMRKNIRDIANDVGRMNIAARLQNELTYNASVQEAKAQGALPDDYNVTYDEMKAAFEDGCFKIVLDNNALISTANPLRVSIACTTFRGMHDHLDAPRANAGVITPGSPSIPQAKHRQGRRMGWSLRLPA